MADTVTIYRDSKGKWRWNRREHFSGNIVADGSEGYENRGDCEEQARRVNAGPVEFVREDGSPLPSPPHERDDWADDPANQPDG